MTINTRCVARMPRRRRRCGVVMVETAMIILLYVSLIAAITDFGMAIFIKATFQHAVREGVRYAVTYQTMSGLGQDASIKSWVKTNSMGFLKGTAGDSYIYIRYYDPSTFAVTSANSPNNIVKVSIEGYQWKWMVPLWRSKTPITISAMSADRMEGLPTGSNPPAR